MRTIYYLMGLPGSGKTTEAMDMIRKNKKLKRVNKDTLRLMLDGEKQDYDAERRITLPIRDYAMTLLLAKGYDVICDDTNMKRHYYEAVCRIAKKVGDVRVVVRYFDTPVKKCIERNAHRERPVPEELIHKMHQTYVKSRQTFKDAYYPPNIKEFHIDPALPNAIIVDMDGTAALNQGVRDYYDMSRVAEDAPNRPVLDLIRLEEKSGTKVLIVSGRDDFALEDTTVWLRCHDVPYDEIFMRVTGDHRRDVIVKEEIYEKSIKGKYNVKYAIDDRPQVVRKWRELGLTVFQLNDIDF